MSNSRRKMARVWKYWESRAYKWLKSPTPPENRFRFFEQPPKLLGGELWTTTTMLV